MWKCEACNVEGQWFELDAIPCTAPDPPPCKWCGKTPICAKDCVGVGLALSGEDIKVIDARDGT